jgi:cytochrome c553
MLLASMLCVDSVAEFEAVDAYADDIRAYHRTLEAPAYPHEIDAEAAALGAAIYARGCATCHGGEGTDYPNLVVPLDEIGTDPAYAVAATDGSRDRFYDWIARSPYGDATAPPRRGLHRPAARRDLGHGALPAQRVGAEPRSAAVAPRTARLLAPRPAPGL